ncbi:MAG: competence/damage-inducible protein A [Phycisphaerae bacterium]|jgi:nicotinamide-nucleotide amidase
MKNNAAIISVGNELLNGHTLDTNSNWLQQRLLTVSVQVVYSCCVSDDISEIKAAIEYASQKAGIILITGGLGPTDDDITRNAIAEFLNVELVHHPQIEEEMRKFFARINRPMVEKNKIQAYLPAGTEVINNPLGTAPGIFYSDRDKIIASMPGVPSEMKRMFDETILKKIENFAKNAQVFVKKLKIIGAGESNIAEKIGNMMERGRNPLINCTVDCGIITLHIIATADTKNAAEKLVNDDVAKLSALLGEFIYSFDGESLAEVVGNKLLQHKKTLATAESCTGGLIAKQITDIPGSSAYFKSGWITYSNEAKISQLGVKKELIEQFGAVSSEVATAMAAGAREKSGADFAIAVTGIAGPTGGTEQKPLGLVYIAIASEKGVEAEKFLFGPRDRDFIRQRTYQNALNLLRLRLGV